MCVIAIYRGKREDPENLKQMETDNPDGTGVIYYKEGIPHYKKGLTMKEVLEINKTMEFPFAFHFRFVTVGKNKLLTHPYEVSTESPLKMEGTAETLLMHNGHWGDWNDKLLDNAINSNKDLPNGDWSDSRAMAYLASAVGPNILKMLTGQKIALFRKNGKITLYGAGWENEKEANYSNRNWEYKVNQKHYVSGAGYQQEELGWKGTFRRGGTTYEWDDVRKEVKKLY